MLRKMFRVKKNLTVNSAHNAQAIALSEHITDEKAQKYRTGLRPSKMMLQLRIYALAIALALFL
jgi:hypothetical protein